MRINRYLAQAGFGSRRGAEDLIHAGRVAINGKTLKDLGHKVASGDVVSVDGKVIDDPFGSHVYLAFHKPPGVVVSRRDEFHRKTIYDILPSGIANPERLRYAGRLDKDSRGLLILSDDGDFIQKLTHPSHELSKCYIVRAQGQAHVAGQAAEALQNLQQRFTSGIEDAGELLRAVSVERVENPGQKLTGLYRGKRAGGSRAAAFQVVLAEGRKRQLRRMFAACGYHVTDILRVSIGKLSIEEPELGEGRSRKIEPEDI